MALTFSNIDLEIAGTQILRSVSGSFPQGEVTALIGPNGSGKSSLLSVVSGLRSPSQGEVILGSRPLTSLSRNQVAKSISLMPQRNPVPASLRVKELVEFGRHPHRSWYQGTSDKDRELICWAMDQTEISHFANKPLAELSGGELQRCWLAMVLAQDTPILMLDEPTSWLDISHQVNLLSIVRRLNKEYGKTVVWVLHDLNQAQIYSDNAILLEQGRVVAQGKVDSVLEPSRLSSVYQTPLTKVSIGAHDILWPEAEK
ncbi:ABC transporter ATP-binding protein [Vibrio sp. SCSIO 43136]|uniref:ABC transporter ATP-binding protein n=1 Tax=Vibrio sp. SCSIO 43136 TaxID=2819101 RepID=UPI002074C6F0|nr:ABC transporter ATP-binding protein [Vibrio sp. SCSIO 43136]USD67619.1 ABC transporter ATP-binding protein [Vibrio sp. SCSIO 43136]